MRCCSNLDAIPSRNTIRATNLANSGESVAAWRMAAILCASPEGLLGLSASTTMVGYVWAPFKFYEWQ